jgi:hypothetical protein
VVDVFVPMAACVVTTRGAWGVWCKGGLGRFSGRERGALGRRPPSCQGVHEQTERGREPSARGFPRERDNRGS